MRKSKKVTRNLMIIGSSLVVFMVLMAIFAPQIAPQDPNQMSLADRYQGLSWQHPFGLDENGSDVLAKVVYGARVSLAVSLSVVSLSILVV